MNSLSHRLRRLEDRLTEYYWVTPTIGSGESELSRKVVSAVSYLLP